jgi:hypothetical protein
MGFFRTLFDPHNPAIELHDVMGVFVMITFLGLAIHNADKFDPAVFGTGVGGVILSVTGAGWVKGKARAADPTCQKDA